MQPFMLHRLKCCLDTRRETPIIKLELLAEQSDCSRDGLVYDGELRWRENIIVFAGSMLKCCFAEISGILFIILRGQARECLDSESSGESFKNHPMW